MTTFNSSVWLAIAEGGRWTEAEVRQAVPSAQKHLNCALSAMVTAGMLDKDEKGRFGVTLECTIPRGLTLSEVLKAAGAA